MNVKIEGDKRFNRAFDVSVIHHRTLEALIEYLGVPPNDEKRNARLGIDPNSFIVAGKMGGGNAIEAVDVDEMQEEEMIDTENVIGPDGKEEQWKMQQEREEEEDPPE
jgi:hypothetical protein